MFMFRFSGILMLFEHILILERARKPKLFWLDLTHVMNKERGTGKKKVIDVFQKLQNRYKN